MKTAIVVFLHRSSQWNPEKSVREQPYWDEHARFMDSLFDAGKVILAGPCICRNTGDQVVKSGEIEA